MNQENADSSSNFREKIVFFGTDEFSAPTLRELIRENFTVAAVVTKPDAKKGRGKKIAVPLVKKIAEENLIPIFQPKNVREIASDLRKIGAKIGVLVSYGKILPQEIIDIFPRGIINIHPSLLPKYRGPSPIETAILNGDQETGISLIQLSEKMDAGPIFVQEKIALSNEETKSSLYKKLGERGAKILTKNIAKIARGEIDATAQDETHATYCRMIKISDGEVDPRIETATEIARKIRAFENWPRVRIDFLGKKTILKKAAPLLVPPGDNWPDVISCAANSFLQIQEIVSPKSGKTMTVADYLRGISEK